MLILLKDYTALWIISLVINTKTTYIQKLKSCMGNGHHTLHQVCSRIEEDVMVIRKVFQVLTQLKSVAMKKVHFLPF